MHIDLRAAPFCTALALVWGPTAVMAEEDPSVQIEELIVTASKAGATKLQDTPLAITAFSSDMLEAAGVKDVRDLASMTPNLLVTQNAAFSQIYIRGIGSNNVFSGSDPSSTIHLDGIYLARPASYLSNFLDVERIEVLRGPQGTLYGRNSVGGTINVISRRPVHDFAAKAQVTLGNYDLRRAEGFVNIPLVDDKLAASLSAMTSRHDGYLKNVVPGVGDADGERMWGVRGQLRFTPIQPLEVLLRADYLFADDSLAGYVKLLQTTNDPISNATYGDFGKIGVNTPSGAKREQKGVMGEVNYDLGEAAQIKSLTAYRENFMRAFNDADATAVNIRRTDLLEEQHQFSQEINLTGKLDALAYIAGVYYFKEHIDAGSAVTSFPTVASRIESTVDTSAIAGFSQLTYAVSEKLSLTAGLRYTREEKTFDRWSALISLSTGQPTAPPISYLLRRVDTALTPKFMVEYRPQGGLLIYASATKGFKSGGYNFTSSNPSQGYDPETLWSYEAGVKLDLFDRRAQLNASAFQYDYKDLQIQSFIRPGVIDVTNAADARVRGLELEGVARPTAWLTVGGNLAHLDAVYENYAGALLPGNVVFDASGNHLSLAPKWSYTLHGQVDAPLGEGSMFARVEYSYRTRQYFTPANRGLDTQKAYGLFNASVGYRLPGGRYQLIAYGRNLGGTDYVTSTASFAAGIVGKVGEPRVYGLRLVAEY